MTVSRMARSDPADPALTASDGNPGRHRATLKSQFNSSPDYVAEAERNGAERYPLYKWTKATLDDPAKAAKHVRAFAIRVGGDEVYGKDIADALEADLLPLAGGNLVTRLSKHDTNPANNLPVPAEFR